MVQTTIFTATYNRSHSISQTISSVLKQSNRDFEYWILDDGSTDETEHRVRPFLVDARVKYFKLGHHGQAETLNWGLEHCRSEYVGFVDSDDELLPDHVSTLVGVLNADPSLDFVLGSFIVVSPEKKQVLRVADYFHPKKTIPVSKIECVLGILFGKRRRFLDAGGFVGDFLDIRLFDVMKKKGFKWKKVLSPTYRYFFGRFDDSLSLELTGQRGSSKQIEKRTL